MSTRRTPFLALGTATVVLGGAGVVALAMHQPGPPLRLTADRAVQPAGNALVVPLPSVGGGPIGSPVSPPPPVPGEAQAHVDCQAPPGGGRMAVHRRDTADGHAEATCSAEVTRSGSNRPSASRAAAGSRTGGGATSRASSASVTRSNVSTSAAARSNVVSNNVTTANNTSSTSTSASTSSSTSTAGGAITSSGTSTSSSSSSSSSFP